MCNKYSSMIMRYILFLCAHVVVFSQENKPSVHIEQGHIIGIKVFSDSGGVTNAYLGLPYAAAPVGDLRFAAPQQHQGWNKTYYASTYRPACPQLPIDEIINQSEDCLFLNIWTPQSATRHLMPVLVFFDGYEFAKRGPIRVSGQDLAVEQIVVITVNYRLNVFGFLCFETPYVRGNMGLLDQYFALLWIRKNVRYFGGDEDKITLYGHSAGAASVALHLISPRTAGYFHRAIIASGSAVSPWHITNDAKSASQKISSILGCWSGYLSSTLKCLRSKNTIDVLKAYDEYIQSGNTSSMLLPIVDTFLPENDRYLPTSPNRAFKSGTYMQVPILTGIEKPIMQSQNGWIKLANQGYIHLRQYMEFSKIPEILMRYKLSGRDQDKIVDSIHWRYIEAANGDVQLLLDQLKYMEFETKLEAPYFLQLQYLLSTYVQPIYVYYLENPGFMFNTTESFISDLLLIFGPLLLNEIEGRRFTAAELRFSHYVRQLWKNFIIFGNPTPNNRVRLWHRYNSVENYIEYLGINQKVVDEEVVHRIRRITFWNNLLPKFTNVPEQDTSIFENLQNNCSIGMGYKHAIYTLSGLLVALLILLLICILLIKKRAKEREQQFSMVY